MCGIHFSQNKNHFSYPGQELLQCLNNRGPDHCQTVKGTIENQGDCSFWTLTSTVLSLRDVAISKQPLFDAKSGFYFAWNGEAWTLDGAQLTEKDTENVFAKILEALPTRPSASPRTGEGDSNEAVVQAVASVLRSITGPFSFVLFDSLNGCVMFGRDRLGRRSLLYREDPTGIEICSLVDPSDTGRWQEVDAHCLFVRCFNGLSSQLDLSGHPDGCSERCLPSNDLPPFNDIQPTSQVLPLDLESPAAADLQTHLVESLRRRVENIPSTRAHIQADAPHVAVLFSGGLDCTVLARLMHEIVPKCQLIDLLNVAFENPRVLRAASARGQVTSPFELCPDRQTGHSSVRELRRACTGRQWRFVSIDVPYDELSRHRSRIVSLMQPHDTEMDLSIAAALYFAARGVGSDNETGLTEYRTPARVLISGLGADELFAGYTRHAVAFQRGGYQGLTGELKTDFYRLGQRNLGRDDRVISHWGKETRYPFLDENLLGWALQLPVWEKCDFGALKRTTTEPEPSDHEAAASIEPGKKLLRLLAWRLGLEQAAVEKKRAIQFGARTAKMEAGRTKGTQTLTE